MESGHAISRPAAYASRGPDAPRFLLPLEMLAAAVAVRPGPSSSFVCQDAFAEWRRENRLAVTARLERD